MSKRLFILATVIIAVVFSYTLGHYRGHKQALEFCRLIMEAEGSATDSDTANAHVPEADIGAEIMAINAKALHEAGQTK